MRRPGARFASNRQKRRVYQAIAWLASGASLLTLAFALLAAPGAQPFPTTFLSTTALLFGTLGFAFRRDGAPLETLEPLLILGTTSVLALALWYGFYLAPGTRLGGVAGVSALLWYPLQYLIVFLAYPERVASRYALAMLALLIAMTLPHGLATRGGAALTDGLLLPTQAYFAGALVILVLRFFAGFQRRFQRMEAIAEAMRQLAHTDTLTGVANRRQIEYLLTQEYRRAERYGRPFSFMMIDIDNFKGFNDSLGHAAGDEILVDLATRLRRKVRSADTVGRWGGEEFVILTPETPLADALRLAELVRGYVGAHPLATRHGVTISLGVSSYQPRDRVADLVARADAALYLAKNSGKNRVQSELDLARLSPGAAARRSG